MIAAAKAEIRKILTIRSTYVILLVTIALLMLFGFYAQGMRAGMSAGDPHKLATIALNSINVTALLGALVGALLVTHEYRYNTIVYTLTASKSRVRTMVAKILVVSVFAIIFSLLVGLIAPLLTLAGLTVKGLHLAPQIIPVKDLLWRGIYGGWGFSMMSLLLASLIRNQVGTLAALFLIPGTVEPLLGMILKGNSVYLPFNVLGVVTDGPAKVSPARAAIIFALYLVVGWAISLVLFVRRDAN